MRLDAVDVARYQKDVDWKTMFDSGVQMAIYKATQGSTYVDPYFAVNRGNSRAAGFRFRLAYHFLSSDVDIKKQAEHFARTVGFFNPGEGIMLDAERDNLTNKEVTEEQCLEWISLIEEKFHRPVAVYSGYYVNAGRIWKSKKIFNGKRPRCLAAYIAEASMKKIVGEYFPDMWQYSSNGPVPGVVGRCDMNHVYDWTKFHAVCGLATLPPVQKPPIKKDKDMPIILTNAEVRNGFAIGAYWYELKDSQKFHELNLTVVKAYQLAGVAPIPMTNDELDQIPDYNPTTPPVETCRFETTPILANVSFTGSGTLS